jgi:uncharacterized protein YjbI with pentapeptide repeats
MLKLHIVIHKKHKHQTIIGNLLKYTNLCHGIINLIIPYISINDFNGINLSNVTYDSYPYHIYKFSNIDMKFSNLYNMNWKCRTDLENINLSNSILDKLRFHNHDGTTYVINCNLSKCKMKLVRMEHSNISSVNFEETDMTGSKFKHVYFSNCNFTNCNMRGIDFRSVVFYDNEFKFANLEYSDIRNKSELEDRQLNFHDAKLTGAKTKNKNMYKTYPEMSYVGPL